MKKKIYQALLILELTILCSLMLFTIAPAQDYALSEFKEWRRHPSPQTLQAYVDKVHEESRVQRNLAISLGAAALTVAIPI